ncbi:hypothetical protein ACFV2V_21620 [Streptomyces sp. NPDC059698]|uniref:hypothetical protein n=1 Tax=unclassified Streptomyces TaxID=2593676 RepID=UPI00093A26A2|nr:hypothetical protein [Streptomyces sp. CB02366]OKJ32445.1 hypothetical protein AMK24_27145 [Streptomyces sp. CB02366]TVP34379.1 hypothetical protein A3L22_13270 [Streptomyces griseus subsp. griseus]WSS57927.1 hypothetical protein OG543_22385 [Streptomyces sp. NBC_01178]
MSKNLAEVEIARTVWEDFRTMGDRSGGVPDALRRLLAASDEDEAMVAYWDLENVVVVQGQLHSAALPTVSVLLAGLLDELSADARDLVLELLQQIVMGEPDEDELALGNTDLGDRCREAARTGLWLVYRELGTRRRETAEAILDRIEGDRARIAAYTAGIRGK